MKVFVTGILLSVLISCGLMEKHDDLSSPENEVNSTIDLQAKSRLLSGDAENTIAGQYPQDVDCQVLVGERNDKWTLLSGESDDIRLQAERLNTFYTGVNPRKLVVFIDGTGNISATSTNIWKLYTLARQSACHSAVIPFYHQGLGTSSGLKRIIGEALGYGIDKHIRDTYKFIAQSYQPGDQVFLFGFSRGAYTARALNGMIEFVGLVDPLSLADDKRNNKHLDKLIKKLYKSYAHKNDGKPNWPVRLKEMLSEDIVNLKKDRAYTQLAFNHISVKAIGLFDTVAALGLERDDFPDQYRTSLYADEGFHALSIDEQRNDFRPLRFDQRVNFDEPRAKEVWFAGAHADVGGGYKDHSGLESVSRHWMLQQFSKFEIFPSDIALECNAGDPSCELGYLHDEFLDAKLFGKFGLHRRKVRAGDSVHGSVLCRYEAETLPERNKLKEPKGRYRPENLYVPSDKFYQLEDYACSSEAQ